MIAKNLSKAMAMILCVAFVHYSTRILYGFQTPAANSSDNSGAPTETAAQDATQLQSLVAPIALYPDALVAQILSASTFPDQVAIADYWLDQNKSLTGSALMQAVNTQSWDPSVKALTQFPSVLDNMAKNLSWTSSLGEAFHNQQADVMAAIQTLRAQAKAKGNLKTTSQITVVQQSPQVIEIQPTNPQVVYVPVYNPAVVYGYPYVVPAYIPPPAPSTADVVAAGLIGFGAGIAVGAMMSGGCCGWGYSSWNCGWHGTAVVYHGGAYYGNSAWHGGYYNSGYHGSYGYNNNYNNSNYHSNNYNNYSHNGNTYNNSSHSGNTYNNVNVNKQGAQNFNSDRSSGSNSWGQHSGGGNSNAFSGMSGHSGGFGDSGGGGWSSRAESSRGWGSMGSSGFGGGRFGGGGGGFGGRGGGFGGGGFRR